MCQSGQDRCEETHQGPENELEVLARVELCKKASISSLKSYLRVPNPTLAALLSVSELNGIVSDHGISSKLPKRDTAVACRVKNVIVSVCPSSWRK